MAPTSKIPYILNKMCVVEPNQICIRVGTFATQLKLTSLRNSSCKRLFYCKQRLYYPHTSQLTIILFCSLFFSGEQEKLVLISLVTSITMTLILTAICVDAVSM